ncbi:uncharacterized protein LOC128163563 [Crassostrea angulata]|uniref:uncharacterized protein LOC128163563 n=1 Tax=Magallana angulata TaxID=2784310 RepID=UPI0022B0D3CB|nr:uncharacterized protein LOC128163563 [Crassostrea angulata]
MNAVLFLTLCLLGMAVAQDHLWTALALNRMLSQNNQPYGGLDSNSIAPKGATDTLNPSTPGSRGSVRRRQMNPMNWYWMDQMVDIPDSMMMWPFLMGGFN